MEGSSSFVLDTSAIFCLKDNEEGAAKVESILEGAQSGHCQVYVSFMSLMEYLYVCYIRHGEETARKNYLELTLLPVTIIESNEELRVSAAELKAQYNLSVADAWIAATAAVENAIFVHKDPEFKAISHSLRCLALPYK